MSVTLHVTGQMLDTLYRATCRLCYYKYLRFQVNMFSLKCHKNETVCQHYLEEAPNLAYVIITQVINIWVERIYYV